MLKAAERDGRWYSRRKGFSEARQVAYQNMPRLCPITGLPMLLNVGGPKMCFRHADHVWPERWVRKHMKGADPHIQQNIFVIHPTAHARKTAAEIYLYAGNWHSFEAEMRKLGYPLEKFADAMAALKQSAAERNAKRHRA